MKCLEVTKQVTSGLPSIERLKNKSRKPLRVSGLCNRADWIRTSDLLTPRSDYILQAL